MDAFSPLPLGIASPLRIFLQAERAEEGMGGLDVKKSDECVIGQVAADQRVKG